MTLEAYLSICTAPRVPYTILYPRPCPDQIFQIWVRAQLGDDWAAPRPLSLTLSLTVRAAQHAKWYRWIYVG